MSHNSGLITRQACTIYAQGRGELDMHVIALGQQGYRIVTVLPAGEDAYTIIAQEWGPC